MTGTVTAVIADRGFAFLRPSGSTDHKELFFHIRETDASLPFDARLLERVVEYEIRQDDRGPRAVNVRAAS